MFDVRSFKANNRVFEFNEQKMSYVIWVYLIFEQSISVTLVIVKMVNLKYFFAQSHKLDVHWQTWKTLKSNIDTYKQEVIGQRKPYLISNIQFLVL